MYNGEECCYIGVCHVDVKHTINSYNFFGAVICDPSCVNGDCVFPGVCLCDSTWTGEDCSQGNSNIRCMYSATSKYTVQCFCELTLSWYMPMELTIYLPQYY